MHKIIWIVILSSATFVTGVDASAFGSVVNAQELAVLASALAAVDLNAAADFTSASVTWTTASNQAKTTFARAAEIYITGGGTSYANRDANNVLIQYSTKAQALNGMLSRDVAQVTAKMKAWNNAIGGYKSTTVDRAYKSTSKYKATLAKYKSAASFMKTANEKTDAANRTRVTMANRLDNAKTQSSLAISDLVSARAHRYDDSTALSYIRASYNLWDLAGISAYLAWTLDSISANARASAYSAISSYYLDVAAYYKSIA